MEKHYLYRENSNQMKKLLSLCLLSLYFMTSVFAQEEQEKASRFSFNNSGEWIFSLPSMSLPSDLAQPVLRFSPWYNVQYTASYHVIKPISLFMGLNVRNVGFICTSNVDYEGETTAIRKKFRTYNFGIPAGITLGNPEKLIVYGGFEIEFPFHYKEKTFKNGVKTEIFKEWLSPKTPAYVTSVFAGVELGSGINLKFKYYLDRFFDSRNKDLISGMGGLTYDKLDAQVMYIAFCFNMFHDLDERIEKMIDQRVKAKEVYLSQK